MEVLTLIEHASEAGIELWVEDGHLRGRGDKRHQPLARMIAERKEEIIAVLMSHQTGKGRNHFDHFHGGDGTETFGITTVGDVSSPYQYQIPSTAQGRSVRVQTTEQTDSCGAVHIQPQRWTHRDGKAYCPRCDRFMGCVRSGP
jgi:hypothetical protein